MNKKQAFTLAELLVVVIVIGVLSAVALPKFNRMLESYKVAEAEQMLEAIRNEQEARCTLGQNYTTNSSDLSTWAVDESKHFTYSLSGEGMLASRKTGEYSLSIPSYEDGRICCDNCEGLNKSYLTCDELRAKPDYKSGSSCAGEVPPSCEAQPDDTSRSCGCFGHYVDHFNTNSCMWERGTECVGEDPSRCKAVPENPLVGPVPDEPEPCEQTEEPEVSCGCGGHYVQTWNQEKCRWEQGSECVGTVRPQKPTMTCGCNNTGTLEYTWNETKCRWEPGLTCNGEDTSQCQKKYLSYSSGCARYGSFKGEYTGSCSGHGYLRYNCNIVEEAIRKVNPNVVIGLPRGCQPGQECDTCVVGKAYVSRGQYYVYCDGNNPETSCTSADIFVCQELPNPPTNNQLDCRNVSRSGGPGGMQGNQPSY